MTIENKNRRRFSRINIQWAVRLDFGLTKYKVFADNVSLSGLYVKGTFNQVIGDTCMINLKESGLSSQVAAQVVGLIARVTDGGIAIEFISMKVDSFFFLQTTLLYKAADPLILVSEFVLNNISEIDKDLITL
jgi:hypothetical protein